MCMHGTRYITHKKVASAVDVKSVGPNSATAVAFCRRWVSGSGDDLGTRAEAALDKAAEAVQDSGRTTGREQQPEAAAEALADDEACHPADPYCSVGEEPPRPDDFHEEGDGSTPPSAGFPA
jgi:hypothetical protein